MTRNAAILAAAVLIAGGCAPVMPSGGIRDAVDLGNQVGKRIIIMGTVSNTPWQHMIDPRPSHPHETYFDMGSSQIIVYSREPIECGGTVRITGTVIMLEGSSKDPRRKETCSEYQVLADSWECLK